MNKADLKVFKTLLIKKKDDLAKGIDHISREALKTSQKDATGDLSAYSLHMADMATDNYDREFSLGLADNERKILTRIENALDRIEDKTFGNCEVCDKKISKQRLKVVPYAELCMPCQTAQEKSGRK